MSDIENIKRLLGSAANQYTSSQLQQLEREIRGMAQLLLDFYVWERQQQAKTAKRELYTLTDHHPGATISTSASADISPPTVSADSRRPTDHLASARSPAETLHLTFHSLSSDEEAVSRVLFDVFDVLLEDPSQ